MVDRCVCYNRYFSEMQKVMIHNKITTLEELKKHITFAENCRLCLPYIQQMIQTGKTRFEPLKNSGEQKS